MVKIIKDPCKDCFCANSFTVGEKTVNCRDFREDFNRYACKQYDEYIRKLWQERVVRFETIGD